MSKDSFDAVIVGSGAGGGAAAYALTQAGFRVCVLEKGPHYKSEDFYHDELEVCRRDYFVPSPLDEPHTVVRPGKTTAERTTDGWIACCVGGGTVHMSGFFFRLHREDFRVRSLYGEVARADVGDWPITYEDLAPFYDEVEKTIGVSGDATANPHEGPRAPFPLAPLLAHPASALVEAGARKVGLRAFPTPRAILSADYNGRAACQYCGFCGGYGCEVGAKSSSAVTFLALAAKSGKLTLQPRAMATRVTTDRRGRARGVTWRDASGATHETTGRVVILACSSIETARLLLISKIGNASGLVGKNLIFAGWASGWGRFPAPSPHWPPGATGLPFIDRSIQDLYLVKDAGLPHPKAGTILFNAPHINPIFQLERLADRGEDAPPLFGNELKRQLREFYADTRTIEWEAFSEFFPHDGCEVTLDPDVKDRFGLPVARLQTAIHPTSFAVSEHLAHRARDVLDAAGATKTGSDPGPRVYHVLQAGTARMGADPRSSVTNRDGELHDSPNVFVADASTFPSAGAAPFTLTIMANALRIARAIAARGKRGEL
jgi:choline dehydrogenase-like flavoprotein